MSLKRKQIPELTKKEVCFNQKYMCNICKTLLPITYEFDHKVPHSISKNDDIDNLQALCNNCHATKTLRETDRINKFKKYCKENEIKIKEICWFCLKECKNKCDKTLKPIIFKSKIVKTHEEFDKMCDDFIHLKVDNDVLKVEICYYNLCIYTNNIIYKSSKNDIALEDIANAIDLSTRSKKFSKKYRTLHIKSLFNFEPEEAELDKYFKFIGENILEYVNERLFKDIYNVMLILE